MNVKRTQAERSEATRAALIAAARGLFAQHGYADTAIEHIVQRAAVTRGALYHHFRDKVDLFRAVFETIEQELVDRIVAKASDASDPWDVLVRGSEAFLDACLEPDVQRIVLIEAPAVLGYDTWRDIDANYGFGLTKAALEAAMESRAIARQAADPLARMLLGALNEAALYMARAEDMRRAREEVGEMVTGFLVALRETHAKGPSTGNHDPHVE